MPFSMTINGRRVEGHDGEMLLASARRVGIHIPTLCAHEAVEPFGSCRLCMVEVTKPSWGGWKGLMTACLYPAAPDLIVETQSERVLELRRHVLDLLLARCPDSTVIQDLAAEHGVHRTSFVPRENPDLCILCGLCTRICETAATSAISTVNRGHDRAIGTPFGDPPSACIGCLACAHVCPTGHIQFTEQGFTRKIWGREFARVACEDCGRPLGITMDQAAFLQERQEMDASYFSRCPDCQRATTAKTLMQMAKWQQMGMTQETQS